MISIVTSFTLALAVLPAAFAAPVPITERSGDILSGIDILNNLGVGGSNALLASHPHSKRGLLGGVLGDDHRSNSILDVVGSGQSSGAAVIGGNGHRGGLPILSAVGQSSGSGLLHLGGRGLLNANGKGGLLGIGSKGGLLGTGLLAGNDGRYYWQAPQGWTRPSWYDFGYFNDDGCWVNDHSNVLAFLNLKGFVAVDLASTSYPLFPTGYNYPSRSVDLTRKGSYGYFTQAGLFVDLALEVNALLGSCGYYNPSYHF